MSRTLLQIGEVARLLGVTPKTVRHYHKLGLLPEPERSEGGYRLYDAADLLHLRHIRRLQSLGLSLQQIQFIFEDDDPDTLLRVTLESLQSELAAQEQRIAARRERIAHYLAEEVSLAEVIQPETPSPTLQMLQEKLEGVAEVPAAYQQFDEQVFAQWDSFDWGENYHAALQKTAENFRQHTEHGRLLTDFMQKFAALAALAEDDPQLALWASEINQSGLFHLLKTSAAHVDSVEPPLAEAMKAMFMQSAEQHFSAAQRRFLELLLG